MGNSDVAVQVAWDERAAGRTVPTEHGGGQWKIRAVGHPLAWAAATAAATAALFLAYLEMARANGVNADGASNALQAWDMLHGNVLLRGWTVTDVSFYTNELLLYAAVEIAYGYHADTVHVVAALTYTLLLLVVAAVAKGRATGREAVIRIGMAVAVVGVPTLGLGAVAVAMGVLHLVGLLAALGAVGVVAVRVVRRRTGHRDDPVTEIIACGILVNLGAFVVSTLPGDLGTARQIVAVLPLGAVLVARVWGPRPAARGSRLAALRWRSVTPALAAVLLVLAGELAVQATARPAPAEGQQVAEWLDARALDYGIGAYWHANNITLTTSGRVHVAPVVGGDKIKGYRWESRADWYDPARHDARFLVLDRWHPGHGTEAQALAQFGQPVARHEFARATVLVYDHNLLAGLAADCVPGNAPSMAQCPRHQFPLLR